MISDDLLSMSVKDLSTQLSQKREELTNLRFQQALQQLEHSHQIPEVRKEIAQIKTLMREYELGRREVKDQE